MGGFQAHCDFQAGGEKVAKRQTTRADQGGMGLGDDP